jgi:hypothetical protein
VANNADFHSAVLRAAHEALAKRELNRKPRPVHGRN